MFSCCDCLLLVAFSQSTQITQHFLELWTLDLNTIPECACTIQVHAWLVPCLGNGILWCGGWKPCHCCSTWTSDAFLSALCPAALEQMGMISSDEEKSSGGQQQNFYSENITLKERIKKTNKTL